MEIERQRGISVSTSVLAFNYQDKNKYLIRQGTILRKTTFRTLTAVDSVIVIVVVLELRNKQKRLPVVECVKFHYCFFINKMDREGKDAFDLMDEVNKN
jgi:peptide chain release factor 3